MKTVFPFGTCGGFQHAILEYARNVLGWHDAAHAETDTEGRMVIAPLSCSLVEKTDDIELRANTLIARAYNQEVISEGYHCNYGVSQAFADELERGDLRVTGWDEAGDIRAIELVTHPFMLARSFNMNGVPWRGNPCHWFRRCYARRADKKSGRSAMSLPHALWRGYLTAASSIQAKHSHQRR